jgi:hypothetical protein
MMERVGYVAMSPQEFLVHRNNGVVSMGAPVDSHRQPGIVGMYGRKPVFLWNSEEERLLFASERVEEVFALRGYKNYCLTDE